MSDQSKLFLVEDVFDIEGRVVAAGSVVRGTILVGDTLRLSGRPMEYRVAALTRFKQPLDSVAEGEEAGITLEAAAVGEVQPGDELGA